MPAAITMKSGCVKNFERMGSVTKEDKSLNGSLKARNWQFPQGDYCCCLGSKIAIAAVI
jgi:hypothetical protein